MVKKTLKGIGFTFVAVFVLLFAYCILFAIGPGGKCIVCSTKTVTDTVVTITEGGVKDVVFHLKHHGSYYINRGLESGLDLASLRKKLVDHHVTISFASPTTHISQLEYEGELIYSQLR